MEKPTTEIDLNEKIPEQYLAEYCHRVSQQSLDFTEVRKNEKINKLLDEIFEIILKNGVINKMEPVKCGCGGEAVVEKHQLYEEQIENMFIVRCTKCDIQTSPEYKKEKAIETWNRAMGTAEKCSTVERTAKIENIQTDWYDDEYINDRMGDMYHFGDCGNCGKTVTEDQKYCPECGAKLDWSNDG